MGNINLLVKNLSLSEKFVSLKRAASSDHSNAYVRNNRITSLKLQLINVLTKFIWYCTNKSF